MILEIRTNDGKKVVFGGNFSFVMSKEKHLFVNFDGCLSDYVLKDYPTYNLGGSMVFCEEAEAAEHDQGQVCDEN